MGGVRPGMWEIKNAMVLCDDNIVLKEAVAVTGLHEDSYGGAYMRLRAKTAAEETVYDLGFVALWGGIVRSRFSCRTNAVKR